eukprot:TRINITY_DN2031_c0_g2_i1.p1 TRINITY_DN2031_c0_g2~~TRINITY_DN2031_c0_g2_i1.p1  ORF type:complete len:310 (-),score=84.21 TRINITY_DN2031_c0_g2_i1:1154-2041(-)
MAEEAQEGSSRHEAFLARHLARHAKIESREDGEAAGGESHMAESVTAFWSDFNDRHQALCSAVDALKAEHAVGSVAVDTAAVNAQLDALVADAQQLQAITAAAAIFLPAYDVRRAGEEAANALAEVEAARAVLVPRKKFSFKAKAKRQTAAAAEAPPPPDHYQQQPPPAPPAEDLQDMPGFYGRSQETLVLIMGEQDKDVQGTGGVAAGMKDFSCCDLKGCTVLMCHVLDALRLRNLRDCRIYSGPIRGSVYVEACHNCTIMVACRQLRVHGSSGIDFYVHTLSGPIIEGCTATR